jgi:hypothetical protein
MSTRLLDPINKDSIKKDSIDKSAKKCLSSNLSRHISAYSLAATAAGVGMLALAQPARGEVIVTKKTIPVLGPTYLDINNDGVNDFEFYNFFSFGSSSVVVKDGAVVGTFYASALVRGAQIGPTAHFDSGSFAVIERGIGYGRSFKGHWGDNPKNRYLGVRFSMNGETHYGWVRLTITAGRDSGIAATITAYAYETTPNKKILAGNAEESANDVNSQNATEQPRGASLGMLALGVDALLLWRH